MPQLRKNSRKRQALLAALQSTKTHPTAEWLYNQLKPEYPELSLGTVYRNLSQLRDDGQISLIATVNGQERYDADISPHIHFICAHCGAVLDVSAPIDVSAGYASVESSLAVKVRSHTLSYHGTCAKCAEEVPKLI